jgi:hypothetical protein
MNVSRDNKRNFMRNQIAILAALTMLAGGAQNAAAGDREWATAGKILTGVVAGAVIAKAIEPAPAYSCAPVTGYAVAPPPAVYVQPAPVVVYPAPIYVRPAPVVVCAPPPVVRFSIGFGGGWRHGPHHRTCW